MASTAAWSAASLSPRPIQRPHPSAAASVTRTSSSARFGVGGRQAGLGGGRAERLRWRLCHGRIQPTSPARLGCDRLRLLVQNDEGAGGEHRRASDLHLPAQRLAEDAPQARKVAGTGSEVGEQPRRLRRDVPEEGDVGDAQHSREDRAQQNDVEPLVALRQRATGPGQEQQQHDADDHVLPERHPERRDVRDDHFAPMTINAYVTAAPIPVAIATASAGEPSSPASAISASPGADNASATKPTRDRRSGSTCGAMMAMRSGRVDGQDRDSDRRALQRLEEKHAQWSASSRPTRAHAVRRVRKAARRGRRARAGPPEA